uniref:Ig-like domain-containing protein n=1 Tax=Cyclopterus lumpus TaxID=8103 RepID=A0A8C2ZP43_CYCLU
MSTQAPTFTQPLQSAVALEGSAAAFEAQVSGSPVPEVSWFRDGQVLSAAALPGIQISFSDGRAVLRIPAVTAAHSGRFSVRATNGAGQATSTAELLVTGETHTGETRTGETRTGETRIGETLVQVRHCDESELCRSCEEAVPAKKTKTVISTSQISQTRQTRVEKRMEAGFQATGLMEMHVEGAELTQLLAHKTPPKVPPKPMSKSPTQSLLVAKVTGGRQQSPSPVRHVKAPTPTPVRWAEP